MSKITCKCEELKLEETKAIGYYTLTNWGGITIYELDDEHVRFRYYDGVMQTAGIESKLNRETMEYESGFYVNFGIFIPLSGCMRIIK